MQDLILQTVKHGGSKEGATASGRKKKMKEEERERQNDFTTNPGVE